MSAPPPIPPPPTLVQRTPERRSASGPTSGPASGTAPDVPPAAPSARRPRRLWWHRLILGLWYRPVEVLDEARDRGAWGAAIALSLLSGALPVLAADSARRALAAGDRVQWELSGFTVAGGLVASLVLGGVTHAIARTLGGNGRFGPTVSLFVVLFWVTDLPRLALAFQLPTGSTVLRAVALTTWGFGYALAVLLIRGQHHLTTRRATLAVTVQMLAALALMKLGPVR